MRFKFLVYTLILLFFYSCKDDANSYRYFKSKDGKYIATLINHHYNPKSKIDNRCFFICYGKYDTIPPNNYIKLSYHCDYSFALRWSNDTLHIANSMSRILEDKRNVKMIYKSNQDSTEYDFANKQYIKPYKRFYFCP